MENNVILEKAIAVAEKNGFDILSWSMSEFYFESKEEAQEYVDWLVSNAYFLSKLVLFSHNFAKAFWGEEKICYICKTNESQEHSPYCSKQAASDADFISWQYHLKEMVLEENPLNYIEKFL